VIGCGKTFVSDCFAELGAAIISADQLAKEVIQPQTSGYYAVLEAFGDHVLLPSGELNRQALANLIFSFPENRSILEAIIHPRVRQREMELLEFYQHNPLVVLEIPLMFETGAEVLCDSVAVVLCKESLRHERLQRYRGMSLEQIRAREASQWSQEKKQARAQHVIDNSGEKHETQTQVQALFRELSR
jgi:dephospho-CoA kinase